MPADSTTEFLDRISSALITLRDLGQEHAHIRWENPDGTPHQYAIDSEADHQHRLILRAGDRTVAITNAPDETHPLNHHHNWAIANLVTPPGITGSYTTPEIINQDGQAIATYSEINLDCPSANQLAVRDIDAAGSRLTVTLVNSHRASPRVDTLIQKGLYRSYPFSTAPQGPGLHWMQTADRTPGCGVQQRFTRVLVHPTPDSELDSLTPEAVIAVERTALSMLHEVMIQRNEADAYAWAPSTGTLVDLYGKYGDELGIKMPDAPRTASKLNAPGYSLTPNDAVTLTGKMPHLVHMALSEPRNSQLDVTIVSGSDEDLPTMHLVETRIVQTDGATLTIPTENTAGNPRIPRTLIGAVSSITMVMSIPAPGDDRRIELSAKLYADQEDGHRVLVHEPGQASEEDLAYYAAEAYPPRLECTARLDYRSESDIYEDLANIRKAITAKIAMGDPDGAREVAERISGQIADYLTDGLYDLQVADSH